MAAEFAFGICKSSGELLDSYSGFWSNWNVLVGLALLISAGILALVLLAARFFRNQQVEVWVRAEFLQLFITGAIAVLALGIVEFMCGISPAGIPVFGSKYSALTTPNFYVAADNYLFYLRDISIEGFFLMLFAYWNVGALSGTTIYGIPLGVGFIVQPAAGLGVLTQVLTIATQGLVLSTLLVLIQIKVIEYLSMATLTYLLPIGVLLRAFEPTRMFGGSLIAISFGMFLMYPVLLTLNDFVIRDAQHEGWVNGVFTKTYADSDYNDYLTNFEERRGEGDVPPGETATLGAEGRDKASGAISHTIIPIVALAMYLFIAGVFLPAINFAVLIAFIKELSMVLGEEMDISTITRLI